MLKGKSTMTAVGLEVWGTADGFRRWKGRRFMMSDSQSAVCDPVDNTAAEDGSCYRDGIVSSRFDVGLVCSVGDVEDLLYDYPDRRVFVLAAGEEQQPPGQRVHMQVEAVQVLYLISLEGRQAFYLVDRQDDYVMFDFRAADLGAVVLYESDDGEPF